MRLLFTAMGCALVGATMAGCEPADHYARLPPPSNGAPPMPLPLSGGTLIALRDGATAVAADPELDALYVVDLNARRATTVALHAGDEPGRLVEDGAGRVHAALRGGGAVVRVDPASGSVIARRPVCAAPRGLAYDAAEDAILVACAGGDLVTLTASLDAEKRRIKLDRDLRDVVATATGALVSTFRSAEIITLDHDGKEVERRRPASFALGKAIFEPDVAWRMVPLASGGVAVAHQRATTHAIDIAPSVPVPYGGTTPECSAGISHAAISVIPAAGSPGGATPMLQAAALPIDVAVSPDETQVAILSGGNSDVLHGSLQTATNVDPLTASTCSPLDRDHFESGAIAIAFDPTGRLLVQTRGRELWIGGKRMLLTGIALDDTTIPSHPGHDVFHRPPGGGSLACASCHPEGREDGRVWSFADVGPRRTQSLAGDITGTAPFHWSGDLADFTALMSEVFVRRMGGSAGNVVGDGVQVSRWLATVKAVPTDAPADPAAVERGRALFLSAEQECATCHSGAKHTDNKTVDVGTGEMLQVPWLVGLPLRAPYRHDGCAATLRDRFTTCADEKHGAALSPA
jgi:DNA-binding beta-propeller fold protein YncE